MIDKSFDTTLAFPIGWIQICCTLKLRNLGFASKLMWEFWLISSTIGANAIERTIMGACGYLGSSTVIEVSFENGPPSEWFGVVSLPGRVELQACSTTSSFEGMGRTGWEASNCGSKMLNTACIHHMTDHHLLMGRKKKTFTTTHHHEWLGTSTIWLCNLNFILLIGGTKGLFPLGGCYNGLTQCTVITAPSNGKPLT